MWACRHTLLRARWAPSYTPTCARELTTCSRNGQPAQHTFYRKNGVPRQAEGRGTARDREPHRRHPAPKNIHQFVGPPRLDARDSDSEQQKSSDARPDQIWRSVSAAPEWVSRARYKTSLIAQRPEHAVALSIDGRRQYLSPIFLRDLCSCQACIDPSTRQKRFLTTDIPASIAADIVSTDRAGNVSIRWENDVPGYGPNHVTSITGAALSHLSKTGNMSAVVEYPRRSAWDAQAFEDQVKDVDYDSYMQDDEVLLEALRLLHSHGLLFLSNVPSEEQSVSRIAQRIGPLKHTFYGETWDVSSVPAAKNVAYTSQDLGFHMDLLYMQQPPQLQFLHCIRSSSEGGASLFTDSYRAVEFLYENDQDFFTRLSREDVSFHYDHPEAHYYHQSRPTIELRTMQIGGLQFSNLKSLQMASVERGLLFHPLDWIEACSWSPPFQAPFSLPNRDTVGSGRGKTTTLNNTVMRWHAAASKFNELIHRPEGVYERLVEPGGCVIFDNRRVLHARKAFEVADAGKERWLRGAYLDKDPYMSKLRVLSQRYAPSAEQPVEKS